MWSYPRTRKLAIVQPPRATLILRGLHQITEFLVVGTLKLLNCGPNAYPIIQTIVLYLQITKLGFTILRGRDCGMNPLPALSPNLKNNFTTIEGRTIRKGGSSDRVRSKRASRSLLNLWTAGVRPEADTYIEPVVNLASSL